MHIYIYKYIDVFKYMSECTSCPITRLPKCLDMQKCVLLHYVDAKNTHTTISMYSPTLHHMIAYIYSPTLHTCESPVGATNTHTTVSIYSPTLHHMIAYMYSPILHTCESPVEATNRVCLQTSTCFFWVSFEN